MEQNTVLMIILNCVVVIYGLFLFIYGKYFRKKDYLFFQNSLYIDSNKDLFRNDSILETQKFLSINQSISKMENLIEEN